MQFLFCLVDDLRKLLVRGMATERNFRCEVLENWAQLLEVLISSDYAQSPAESHLCFQVLLKMGLSRQEGVAISFQPADHQRPLQECDDESGRFLRIDTLLDLLLPNTGADDRTQELLPLPQTLQSAVA